MALTRAKKAEKVTELAKELEGSTSAIVGTFAKLTVAQDYNLRKTSWEPAPHVFHIHVNPFQYERQGPLGPETVWKDTVIVHPFISCGLCRPCRSRADHPAAVPEHCTRSSSSGY